MRAFDPTAGQILFRKQDGTVVDVAEQRGAAMKELRRDIQYIFQDPFLIFREYPRLIPVFRSELISF